MHAVSLQQRVHFGRVSHYSDYPVIMAHVTQMKSHFWLSVFVTFILYFVQREQSRPPQRTGREYGRVQAGVLERCEPQPFGATGRVVVAVEELRATGQRDPDDDQAQGKVADLGRE